MSSAADRFLGQAERYAGSRPAYPEALARALSRSIVREPPQPEGLVVDVGSGTGIFTRQLRTLLPMTTSVIGIEPASDMRRKAEDLSVGAAGIRYLDGLSQRLPLAHASARAVVAATAAHWFDRPAFFHEAQRVLMPRGILAIVEYVRDVEHSPAAAAVVEFLARHGGPRAYDHPDYAAELRQAAGFGEFEQQSETVTLQLAPAEFVGLALSSSHARAAVDTLGEQRAAAMLLQAVAGSISSDGRVPFGYVFHLYGMRRK